MSSQSSKGIFIALEGGEGAGKSTQARMLAEALEHRGIRTDVTREPGGTPGAEAIRSLLLSPPSNAGWSAEAEALLFAAARSDHVEHRIRPALASGQWVVCDRFVDSSRAYQGGAGALGDGAITSLHGFGSKGLRPDLTILINVSAEKVEERLAKRDGGQSDAIGGRSVAYHRRVAEAFQELADKDPEGFAVISGDGSIDEVHALILDAVDGRFKGHAE